MYKLSFGVAVHLSLLTTFAAAQSPTATVKEFGLLGTWALDCSQPAGPRNAYVDFAVAADGTLEVGDDFGPDYDEMVYRIVEAKRLSHFRLGLRQVLTSDERIVLDTVMLKSADRMRNWSSAVADGGDILVENGQVALTQGRETDWLNRCDQRRADNRWRHDYADKHSQIPRHADAVVPGRLVLELAETGG